MTDRIDTQEDMPELPAATQTTPRRRHGSLGTATFGLVLVGIGLFWLLDRLDVMNVEGAVVLPLILTAVGVALLIGSFDGEHAGLVVLGVFLSVGVLIASTTPLAFLTNGVGERVYSPTSEIALDEPFRLGIGELRLDLSELAVIDEAVVVGELGIGELRVVVPAGVAVDITSEVGAGEIKLFGATRSGTGVSDTFRSANFDSAAQRLVLELDVAIGAIEVTR